MLPKYIKLSEECDKDILTPIMRNTGRYLVFFYRAITKINDIFISNIIICRREIVH